MGMIESFPTVEDLKAFINEKRTRYGSEFEGWLSDYTEDNRFYIANTDTLISNEEILQYI